MRIVSQTYPLKPFHVLSDCPCYVLLFGVEGNVLTCCRSKLHHQSRKWQKNRKQSTKSQRQSDAMCTCESAVFGSPGAPRTSSILFIIKRLHFVLGQMSQPCYTLYYVISLMPSPKRSTPCRPSLWPFESMEVLL